MMPKPRDAPSISINFSINCRATKRLRGGGGFGIRFGFFGKKGSDYEEGYTS
jgi:hypothetical protein